ncbi:putative aminotransferase (plasmid) [Methylorubrum extorquens DM4]|uniref:Aminotransferase n=2 Tax=Methylorubrum extorquens TaxID=408 RepID=A0A2P9HAW8_METED|nr:putative aminotransferase [Methylorubrum extorquens DM4]
MSKVKFLDLKRLNAPYAAAFTEAANSAISSGVYIGGETVRQFELDFASFCGARECVAVGNGLDALILSLRALMIGPGDEVIVPGHTFIATWLAVSQVGATIVPVDVDQATGNIDVRLIRSVITSRTRAIIPVHLYGTSADLPQILEIAKAHNIYVVEDAAQAHGDTTFGQAAGNYGHIGCFSFYPSKNLGALGDSGGIITQDKRLADRVRELANYGSIEKYVHNEKGLNSRMDPIQASFLSIKLTYLPSIIKKRKAIAASYTEALLKQSPSRVKRLLQEQYDGVWHNFVVLTDHRVSFMEHMQSKGIETAIHYPKVPSKQPCYADDYGHIALPVSEQLCASVVSLPIGEYLGADEVKAVCDALLTYMGCHE